MTTQTTAPELLAVIRVNGMAGSFERGIQPAETLAKRCAKRVRQDFGRIFNIPSNHIFTVAVYDVSGLDKVSFDGPYCYREDGTTIPMRETIKTQ